ncbi:sensor domain-containing phosphodiesterase [Aureimonas jatrophae]|uniref:EAL domain, c-di-GMP-specific phosphodiesterase class I (Or its enzymatically inactive variant) n=1 Tax=Aureimonas jatrophae TaxID=1166073 RepID=A0A1H0MZL0_9HYPH|nr:sensor domain-containing phosphodiesterase [Aureimonas jatrophae]MBB3952969.1 EAL domain-containing protein (putative c-di-GMP-specific phosphodiesterase class I)/GGDEF domain-containing protein [Aureimonas jatrophae]SDO85802.1 EAL domain, c-di-GMP-specific phosphodiesterase class I (or its enzymatically inactive variant) [Aureimonas jatrophae]
MAAYIQDTIRNEEARLNALRDLNLLDTSPSDSFDRLTRLASKLLDAPVSTISLTDRDRQWFKSKVGVDITEIPRKQAPCSYAIGDNGIFVVPDLQADPRFIGSPLAQAGIRFYAGAPLFTRQGYGLGTLCVVDDKVRELDDEGRQVLRDLAGMVMSQIELSSTIGRSDAVTGLPNQHQMFEDIEDLARLHPGETATGLMFDLVSQRQSNQGQRVLGSSFTEALVRGGASRLRQNLGNSSRLYHVGPTRLAVLVTPEFGGDPDALIHSLANLLRAPVECDGIPVTPTLAVGSCLFQLDELSPRDALRRMLNAVEDAALSENGYADYSPGHDLRHARSFMLLNDFRAALETPGQLRLDYQPRVDLASGACSGVEALLRWTHPQLGPVPPFDFIPDVEQTAFAKPLTEWVARTALAQIVEWRAKGIDLKVSINVSARNLDEPDFAERMLELIRVAGADPAMLELEFTESAVARNGTLVVRQLQAMRDAGITIAIDDFGSGYSNLSYLQKLPASILKVDRTFIAELETSERDQTLVRSVIEMAHQLGYRVVAEGIETQETYDLVRSWGCAEGQGYLMAKPMTAATLTEWLSPRCLSAVA